MKDKIAIVGHHGDPFIGSAIERAKMSGIEVIVVSPGDVMPKGINEFKREPIPYEAPPIITSSYFNAPLTRKERRKLNRKQK